jgi:hypothetical protein
LPDDNTAKESSAAVYSRIVTALQALGPKRVMIASPQHFENGSFAKLIEAHKPRQGAATYSLSREDYDTLLSEGGMIQFSEWKAGSTMPPDFEDVAELLR